MRQPADRILITRPRDLQDNATPSGNAMAATTLLKLAGFTNDLRYVDVAHQALAQVQPMARCGPATGRDIAPQYTRIGGSGKLRPALLTFS